VNDYAHAYRLLGVPPNCSLQTLKEARRRLVKSWHPDHFPVGTEIRHQAEERIKDINTAFEHLIGYYKQFGTLPKSAINVPTSPVAVDPIPTGNIGTPKRPAQTETSDVSDRPVFGAWFASAAAPWILILAGVFLAVAIGRVALKQEEQTIASTTAIPPQTTSEPLAASDSSQPSPAAPSRDRYFTIGSTLGEVYAVQGVPTSTTSGAWRYGKSIVYFANGLVTSWEEDPANPLKTTMLSISTPETPHTFTLGSTKEEVRAAEGAPLFETGALWDYGLSKVYFREDRVVGWESSPLRPLKVRK
jgi:DnaJ domain